jgi:hypothetical protein
MFATFFSIRNCLLVAGLIVVVQGIVLYMLGQPPICTCGSIKLWEGVVLSSGNSQHLTDWYTFSHVIHGILFYCAAWLLFPKTPWYARLMLAVGVESMWEMIENTPWVINHYREQALAQGYMGDSILNSVSDTIAMLFGFFLAFRLPVWVVVALSLCMEVFVGYMIRDNLTLNVINLIYQFDFVSRWQSSS